MGLRSWLIHKLGGYTYEDVYGRKETNDDYVDLTELSKVESTTRSIHLSPLQSDITPILAVQSPNLPPTQVVPMYRGVEMSQLAASQAVQWNGLTSANDIRSACCFPIVK